MCGIVGYVGTEQAVPKLLKGLEQLEYRGYDSVGIAVLSSDTLHVFKCAGKGRLPEFRAALAENAPSSTIGIGHTRWATHGAPTLENAHPHLDCRGEIAVVHNGVIENYLHLAGWLAAHGHTIKSETDTEILVHLIEHFYQQGEAPIEDAVCRALREVNGTYGIVVLARREPTKLIAARFSSPVFIGVVRNGGYLVASGKEAILPYTDQCTELADEELAILTPSGVEYSTLARGPVHKPVETITETLASLEKGGYPHFMLKEIYEQPEAVANTLRGRLLVKEGTVRLGGIESIQEQLRTIERLMIVGCGTASYAGLYGSILLEEYANLHVDGELASEFRYRKESLSPHTAVLTISQSGETADTREAAREAKRRGVLVFGMVNRVGSMLAREVGVGIYNHAGPEIAVASTKVFLSQLAAFVLLGLYFGQMRGLSPFAARDLAKELEGIPTLIEQVLSERERIKALAEKYKDAKNFLYLGRKYSYPVALEGALKLKEISYIHAEGCAAGEMKHGPLALIDEHFPTMAVVPHDTVYDKVRTNLKEIQARKGPILAVTTKGNHSLREFADDVIEVPHTLEPLSPLLTTVALQLFAYEVAVAKGLDPDRPRNLAKSVTVE